MEMYLTNECSLDEVALEEITPTINIHYNGELDKYLSCTIGNEEELENINPTCYSVSNGGNNDVPWNEELIGKKLKKKGYSVNLE